MGTTLPPLAPGALSGLSREALEDLLTTVIHDLRTPAQIIGDYADQLDKERSPEVRAHYLDVIRHSAGAIQGIAEDLAAAFRPQACDTPSLLDVREALKGCLRSLALQANRAGVTLRFAATPEPSMCAYISRHQFERVVLSLASLAVRRAARGGRAVQVSLIATEKELRVELQDSARVPDPASGPEQTGLAFAIAKRVIERHGGAVWTGDGKASGSFGLTLPRACVELAAPAKPPRRLWESLLRLLTRR